MRHDQPLRGFRNGIQPAGCKRVTAEEPTQPMPEPAPHAVNRHRLGGVFAARGMKLAGADEERPDQGLVGAYQEDNQKRGGAAHG